MTEKAGVSIRTGRLDDAKKALEIQQEVIAEKDYFISVVEEFDKTVDQQRKWLKEMLENDRDNFLVAEVNGVVIGWLVFKAADRKRVAHTGTFGVMLQKEFRNRGIGRLLIEELLKWAIENPLIEKVSLGVFSTNERAISLYKSLGFIEEGRKVREFKNNEDEYMDDILMYKWVGK